LFKVLLWATQLVVWRISATATLRPWSGGFLLAGSYVTDFPESLSHLTDLTAETSAHSPKNETVTMKRKYVGNENLQGESS